MPTSDRVLITGAGPVGLVAAANLVRHGVPVTVFEGGPDLSTESRASTFHPPTLDMLGDLDVARPLIAQGLIAPKFQYRNRRDGLIAQFDFSDIAEATRHPFRLQCEQSKLTRIICDRLRGEQNFDIAFSMVRPCSCPASKRSWQGAPKTRSTPCLRHPIPRSP